MIEALTNIDTIQNILILFLCIMWGKDKVKEAMKCFTCKTEMKCVDDINEVSTRIDFVECPKCHSKADIIYGNNGEYIEKVEWVR